MRAHLALPQMRELGNASILQLGKTPVAERGYKYDAIRESWLADIKNELPRQRYAVWVRYTYQLEEMDSTGTISDRIIPVPGYAFFRISPGYHVDRERVNLPDIRRCCCWAHLRRYFMEADPKGKELDYSNPAAQGVQYCNKLFEHERHSREKGHTFEQRKEYRLEKEKPVLDAFWEWVSQKAPKKGTRFEKAVNYAQNHREEFLAKLAPWDQEVIASCSGAM